LGTAVRLVTPAVDLFWIPLGAGGTGFVRMNGRIYEAAQARRQGRQARDLYHTALQVVVPEGRYIVENAWPSPDAATTSRGVVLEGPVFSRRLMHLRWLRYEVRCWRDGVISDANYAVNGPQRLSNDPELAMRIIDRVGSVPAMVWGRDELGVGEMWNSNSLISWVLTRCGIAADDMSPPARGYAPGWRAGIAAARNGVPMP
jgi:hypothetical protein